MSGYENATLNPQVRHNVFLIFREALNNAVKYSKSPEVKVRLEFLDSQLTLEVSDSGIGFDPQSVSAGNGLYTLKKRAQMLKGHFTFESAPGKGTHLFLRIKLSRLKPIA
ncbi:MAG: ATP-binding protein, partial [Bacteroidetes bacterium]|nr:ATP-binding protein [Bacteroidota bacterium]